MSIVAGVTYVRSGSSWVAPGREPLTISVNRDALVYGDYEPDETNTGLLPGVPLTQRTTALNVTTAGAVYESIEFLNDVRVNAANVTFRNCWFRGPVVPANPGPQNLVTCNTTGISNAVFEDCLFQPQTPTGYTNGLNGHDFSVLRCQFKDVCDGMQVYDTAAPGANTDVVVKGCLFHRKCYGPDINTSDDVSHGDDIQLQGGANNLIYGNTFKTQWAADICITTPPTTGSVGSPGYNNGGSLTAIMFNNNVGVLGSQVIRKNFFYGGNIPINIGSANGAGPIEFYENKFDRTQGYQSTGGDNTGTVICDDTVILASPTGSATNEAGKGTALANTYMDNGHEVNIRRGW